MEFIKLEDPDSQEFKEAWKIYESSFPPDEKRSLESQKQLMANKQYNLYAATGRNALVAIIAEWDFGDFIFVEHLAVKEGLRGEGIGTELLEKHVTAVRKRIVLEVERETGITAERIRFYEKIGFKLNAFGYIQPPYGKDKKPVPMLIMTYPEKINESEFSSIRERLHTAVYGLKKPLLGGGID